MWEFRRAHAAVLIAMFVAVSFVGAVRPKESKQGPNIGRIPPKCRRFCAKEPVCREQRECLRTTAIAQCEFECRNTSDGTTRPACAICRDRVCPSGCTFCKVACGFKRATCIKTNCTTECFGSVSKMATMRTADLFEDEDDGTDEYDDIEIVETTPVRRGGRAERRKERRNRKRKSKKLFFSDECVACKKSHCKHTGVVAGFKKKHKLKKTRVRGQQNP